MRGETQQNPRTSASAGISIHSPRAGRDPAALNTSAASGDFNPLSPCGERHKSLMQSQDSHISIHSPRAGRDVGDSQQQQPQYRFQSTLPVRGETGLSAGRTGSGRFQSTLPVRGETVKTVIDGAAEGISIHSPRAGRDCVWPTPNVSIIRFQSTLPVRGETLKQFGLSYD